MLAWALLVLLPDLCAVLRVKRVAVQHLLFINPTSFMCVFSNDEDEEVHSTDPESKEKNKDKKSLCKVKWSRDEVSLGSNEISLFMCCKHLQDGEG